jgi:hypothetical protein
MTTAMTVWALLLGATVAVSILVVALAAMVFFTKAFERLEGDIEEEG